MGVVHWVLGLRPEWVALTVNLLTTVRYVWLWNEPGKILYWVGATVLTAGLLLMKG